MLFVRWIKLEVKRNCFGSHDIFSAVSHFLAFDHIIVSAPIILTSLSVINWRMTFLSKLQQSAQTLEDGRNFTFTFPASLTVWSSPESLTFLTDLLRISQRYVLLLKTYTMKGHFPWCDFSHDAFKCPYENTNLTTKFPYHEVRILHGTRNKNW